MDLMILKTSHQSLVEISEIFPSSIVNLEAGNQTITIDWIMVAFLLLFHTVKQINQVTD